MYDGVPTERRSDSPVDGARRRRIPSRSADRPLARIPKIPRSRPLCRSGLVFAPMMLAAPDDSRRLRVLGRSDAIQTGGLTVMPALVEAAGRTSPRWRTCAVFGSEGQRLATRVVGAAVVLAPGSVPLPTIDDIKRLRGAIRWTRRRQRRVASRTRELPDELPRLDGHAADLPGPVSP